MASISSRPWMEVPGIPKRTAVKPTGQSPEIAFAESLQIPTDALRASRDIAGQYYITGNVINGKDILYLTGTGFMKYPLLVKDLTPITPANFAKALIQLLTSSPVPEKLNRKSLPLKIEVSNNAFTLDLRLAKISLLKWFAEELKSAGEGLQWLPIIQDLIWLEWGWKTNPAKKKKQVAKRSKIRAGQVGNNLDDIRDNARIHLGDALAGAPDDNFNLQVRRLQDALAEAEVDARDEEENEDFL